MKRSAIVALSLFIYSSIYACDEYGKSGFVEDNNLSIPAHMMAKSNITEKQFNQVLDAFRILYGPIFNQKGATLKIEGDWAGSKVNAYASQLGNLWKVNMFGGLARHRHINTDSFAMVVCHEIGHHIGGAPKKSSGSWVTNEGQSDYFAVTKCFRRFVEKDDNKRIVSKLKVPRVIESRCQKNFNHAEDIAICKRATLAGLGLGKMLASLRRRPRPVNINKVDSTIVSNTNHRHPKPQCRLDTYFSGAQCERHFSESPDSVDPNIGYCNRVQSDSDGLRPLCWYKP